MSIHIRPAQAQDAALILHFIKELAVYERAGDQVAATEDDIVASLFGADSSGQALICEVDGEPAGYAVYFYSYSTWLAKKGLYLEDLYISPRQRAAAPASSCCATWRGWRWNRAAAALNGACWTGTSPPSTSTCP